VEPEANGSSNEGMRRSICIFFLSLNFFSGHWVMAQEETRFLYVQSDPPKLFSIIRSGQIQASNAAGYLILTGLPAGEVELMVRLGATQRYRIDLRQSDKGFSLRARGDQWVLWDIGHESWLEPIEIPAEPVGADSSDASPFARMLARAAQDPSLLSNRRAVTPAVVAVPVEPSKPEEPVSVADRLPVVSPVTAPAVETPSSDSTVVVKPEAVADSVWQAVYYVVEGERIDTVRIVVDAEPLLSSSTGRSGAGMVSGNTSGLPSGCLAELAEPEFLQMRGRMAAASGEEEMVAQVRRVIRSHCLSVSQARRLSNIFLYEETRYRFFEAIRDHVSDPSNFKELGSYLTEPVYQKRFQSLLDR